MTETWLNQRRAQIPAFAGMTETGLNQRRAQIPAFAAMTMGAPQATFLAVVR